ncbi:hypothetical protein ACJO5Y_17165 [Marinobacter sp. GN3S48]|uniref:hypothetical protein n=1 Tax=Marinobacter sp. GN3S48 TaxID=3382302 RepID=UPI00387A9E04
MRRNLVIASGGVLALTYIGVMPEKIPLLNIPVTEEAVDEKINIVVLVVLAYLTFNFLFTAALDVKASRDQRVQEREQDKAIGVFQRTQADLEQPYQSKKSEKVFESIEIWEVSLTLVLPVVLGFYAMAACVVKDVQRIFPLTIG